MNYKERIAELVAKRDGLNVEIKALREESKATKVADADAREANARKNVVAGATVTFLFKGEPVEGGKVLRVSEKSVTVESAVFAKDKGYRKYSEIVEVTSVPEAVEAE
jgi:hypothetical protein